LNGKERILLVEDDPAVQQFFTECLDGQGYHLEVVSDGLMADERLKASSYQMVLADVQVPGLDGLSLLAHHVRLRPETKFMIITGFGTIDQAVRAMKLGACDFLTKPVRATELRERVQKSLASRVVEVGHSQEAPQLIGESPRFQHMQEQLGLVAPMPTTVLLTGETGAGKEVAARFIHARSPRSRAPLVSLHCGAVPDTLLEDEIFGHVRGAFTGAVASRPGCFEMADGGTLFLDEIGTMTMHLQSKLLRVLQDQELRRLGDTRTQRVNVRVIAATNGALKKMIAEGAFRPDLYYRLAVFPVELPPLRERAEDVLLLAEHFCQRVAGRLGLPAKVLSPSSRQALSQYGWPGNVRQLENAVERAVVVSRDRETLEPEDFQLDPVRPLLNLSDGDNPFGEMRLPEHGICFDSMVSRLERELILKSLERSGGNKKQAARLLQMKRTTLIEKLKRLNSTA
jgi:DNA-binding NtrC family response regulator